VDSRAAISFTVNGVSRHAKTAAGPGAGVIQQANWWGGEVRSRTAIATCSSHDEGCSSPSQVRLIQSEDEVTLHIVIRA